jgi:hypothetical protein
VMKTVIGNQLSVISKMGMDLTGYAGT